MAAAAAAAAAQLTGVRCVGCAPRARMAFWATASSLSWLSRLSMSIGPMDGLLTFIIATARGTPRLERRGLSPQYWYRHSMQEC